MQTKSPYLLVSLVAMLLLQGWAVAANPYSDFSKLGAGFYGTDGNGEIPENLDSVRIGLTTSLTTSAGKQMLAAVTLAIEEANAQGGYRGKPYELMVRADDGPWGTASKKIVELIYEENVWAILGSLDGKRAHLAELIAAKAWIPIVTPTARDRSIDYANVPWMFRCMPDDGRQAEMLLRYAKAQGYQKVMVLSEGEREARRGVERLRQAAQHMRYPISQWLEYSTYAPLDILPHLRKSSFDTLIVWGTPDTLLILLPDLRRAVPGIPILSSSEATFIPAARLGEILDGLVVTAPYDLSRPSPKLRAFQQEFEAATSEFASPIAVFSYDAMRMLIGAIGIAGLNRVQIRDALNNLRFDGLTGEIHFDNLGGNPTSPVLLTLQVDQWRRIN